MASIKKVKKQAERKERKDLEKAKAKAIKDREDAKKRASSKIMQDVRSVLQFDKIKLKRRNTVKYRRDPITDEIFLGELEPCMLSEILMG